ncbi:MAG TPA: tripartite tricarboxylate transporter substrate binding protein [Burkholderiales bacterium]|jgi:tripartite-type tricarboxylate transporter receptor subunit TctC|nr:tripartite tricarboxylate transporter substrate binding protein [Burkholderiales bacterium]
MSQIRAAVSRSVIRSVSLALACFALLAHGQTYPARPVKMVVPFSPGGPNDIIARLIGNKLGEALGQQMVIDNRPGGGGNIGTDAVAKAPPDGYTLLSAGPGSLIMNPVLMKVPYDTARDFAPVSLMAHAPNVLVVHPSVPAKTLKELLALARAQPGRLNYASSGPGSSAHVAVALFASMAHIDITHVPYRGTGPAVNDLVAGQVQLAIVGIPPVLPHVKNGRLRALGVTGKTRSPELPDVPTVDEAGVPGYVVNLWYGLLVPTGTPQAIVTRLASEVTRIVRAPEMREKLAAAGAEPGGGTPEDYAAVIRADTVLWTRVIREAGIKGE